MEILQQGEHLDQQDPNAISARSDQLLQSREEAFKEAEANIALAQKKHVTPLSRPAEKLWGEEPQELFEAYGCCAGTSHMC